MPRTEVFYKDGRDPEVFFTHDLAGELAIRLGDLAQRRWEATQTFVYQGVTIPADSAAGSNVTGALMSMQLPGGPKTRRWKLGDGNMVDLTFDDLAKLGQAMAAHVQACFDHEADLAAQLQGLDTLDAVCDFDIEAGWPD